MLEKTAETVTKPGFAGWSAFSKIDAAEDTQLIRQLRQPPDGTIIRTSEISSPSAAAPNIS
jgi:hypothetical protein